MLNGNGSQQAPQQQQQQQHLGPHTLQHGNYLRPPSMNDSQTSSSSANSNDTPKTQNDNMQLNVPTMDSMNAKPLGELLQVVTTAIITSMKRRKGNFR